MASRLDFVFAKMSAGRSKVMTSAFGTSKLTYPFSVHVIYCGRCPTNRTFAFIGLVDVSRFYYLL